MSRSVTQKKAETLAALAEAERKQAAFREARKVAWKRAHELDSLVDDAAEPGVWSEVRRRLRALESWR